MEHHHHHHHTSRVRSIQAGGIHDNCINISRATYKHPCHCASNPNKKIYIVVFG
jgi:hypothetical protein